MTQDNAPLAPKESSPKHPHFGVLSVLAFIIALAAVAALLALLQTPRGGYGGFYFSPAEQGNLWFILVIAILLWILATIFARNALAGHKKLLGLVFILSIGLLVIGGCLLSLVILLASGPAM